MRGLILFSRGGNRMSQKTTKTTTPKSTMPKKSNKGQFAKGNTVGEQTRFEKENAAANKYKDE